MYTANDYSLDIFIDLLISCLTIILTRKSLATTSTFS